MWSSKSSSIWHQGWMLCWKSPARKLHFSCFQHFFPRLNTNHFINNQMTRYIELLYWCVMVQQGDKIFCFPVIFKLFIKSGKCGVYFIENSWRLQWTWSSSESAFCHFYYTVYRVYTSIARKSIMLKSTLKAHLIIISGQHGNFILTSTQLVSI